MGCSLGRGREEGKVNGERMGREEGNVGE